jgi:hypothetical protein
LSIPALAAIHRVDYVGVRASAGDVGFLRPDVFDDALRVRETASIVAFMRVLAKVPAGTVGDDEVRHFLRGFGQAEQLQPRDRGRA